MAKKVEGISVRLYSGCRKFVKVYAAFFQGCDNGSALSGIAPFVSQIRSRWIDAPYFLARVVGIFLHTELFAIRVEFVDEVGGNFDPSVVHVIFAWFVTIIVVI